MVRMRGGGCNKSKPLSLATVDVSVYPSCHAESCHVTVVSFVVNTVFIRQASQ